MDVGGEQLVADCHAGVLRCLKHELSADQRIQRTLPEQLVVQQRRVVGITEHLLHLVALLLVGHLQFARRDLRVVDLGRKHSRFVLDIGPQTKQCKGNDNQADNDPAQNTHDLIAHCLQHDSLSRV